MQEDEQLWEPWLMRKPQKVLEEKKGQQEVELLQQPNWPRVP
jgi:hypothetical protein